ncbi:MAG: oligosaccharide flippase family protein [Sphingomonas sp.]|nr:oligosaccharide flippase family protein [Sphingomonas sp.]
MKSLDLKSFRSYIASRTAVSEALIGQVGWTTAGYFLIQIIRFLQNVILTHLLMPSLFGIMIIITSLRIGVELFTDIGVGQNLISNRNGFDERFYNTAWTIQLIRGFLLAIIFFIFLPFLGRFYSEATLNSVLPITALLFILTGAHSIGPILAAKALDTKSIAQYEVRSAILGSIITLSAVLVSPNVWGLVFGNILSTIASTILSYFVMPNINYKMIIDRTFFREIMSFGRWIFLSSIVYFLSSNFDRVILAKYISLTMLGVYGISRSLGDIIGQFALRLGNTIIFPLISSSDLEGISLSQKIGTRRKQFLFISACGISIFIASGDVLVNLIYDERYKLAGTVLPWVGISTWLYVINTVSDSVMLGIRKPLYGALGNVMKFAVLLVFLPLAALKYGIIGAVMISLAAEFGRYAVLTIAQIRQRISFVGQDVLVTLAMIAAVFGLRVAAHVLGLAGAVGGLFVFTTS